jgi:hypothetical protein
MQENKTSQLTLILSWVFVALPLIWGVSQTFVKVAALFK